MKTLCCFCGSSKIYQSMEGTTAAVMYKCLNCGAVMNPIWYVSDFYPEKKGKVNG